MPSLMVSASRQVIRRALRQRIEHMLTRFHFGKVHLTDPDMRQRKIRRALARETATRAWRDGIDNIDQIQVVGGC